MELPSTLPKRLAILYPPMEEELFFKKLKRSLPNLIDFFLAATQDETWCDEHPRLLNSLLMHLTKASDHHALASEREKQILRAIRKHFPILKHLLPNNLDLQCGKEIYSCNTLLLSASSLYLKEWIKHDPKEIPLRKKLWDEVIEYMQTGEVEHLWREEKEEIYALIEASKQLELNGLDLYAQEIVKRYVDAENAIDTLIFAHTRKMFHLRAVCQEFISSKRASVKLPITEHDEFGIEFLHFNEESLSLFNQLAPYITLIRASGVIPEEPEFLSCVQQAPLLQSIDISGCEGYSEQFLDFPENLKYLDLSLCFWLNQTLFHSLVTKMPELFALFLRGNVHLPFAFWTELTHLKGLKILDVSKCRQLTGESFQILLTAASSVTDLYLSDCQKISDRGFFELPTYLPEIYTLDLSRCQIGDGALLTIAERCKDLVHLSIERCPSLSERALLELVRIAKKLRTLKGSSTQISTDLKKRLKAFNPYLKILSR